MSHKSARPATPPEEVFSNCDLLRLIMRAVLRDLHLFNSGGASPSKPCSLSLLRWRLRLQLTSRTMRSVLRQLPLCLNFSDRCNMAPKHFQRHGDQAWKLLLRCKYPIATLRCACLLSQVQEGLVLWVRPKVMLAVSSRCCGPSVPDWAQGAVRISAHF